MCNKQLHIKLNKYMLSSGRKTFYNFYISAQCENGTIKCEKKKKKKMELPNMTKVQLRVILVLHNVRISNVRKK